MQSALSPHKCGPTAIDILLMFTLLLASPVRCSTPSSSLIRHADEHYRNYGNYKSTQSHQSQPANQLRHSSTSAHLSGLATHPQNHHLMTMNNLTASVGRNGTFECVFPDLKGDFRLAWFHREKHRLLALHDSVIVKNGRISVRSHGNTTFYLTVHDIRYDDRGAYECQINSVPMRKRIGYLEVNVPPSFKEELTSSDVDISEEGSVSLRCSAHGRPPPEISWRREDGKLIDFGGAENKTGVSVWKGDFLNITAASRAHSGAYLCIASNGIPSPISKRIFLGVTFAPVIWSNREELGVYIDASVVLQCNLEAYPRPSYYWLKDDHLPPIIQSDKKYDISLLEGNTSYRFILRLQILNVLKSDFGKYSCVVKTNNNGIPGTLNGAGAEAKASLRLYEIQKKHYPPKPKPKPATPPHTPFNSRRPFYALFETTKAPGSSKSGQKEGKDGSANKDNIRTSVGKVLDAYSINGASSEAKTEVIGSLDYELTGLTEVMEEASENKASQVTLFCSLLFSLLICLISFTQHCC